MCGIAGLVSFGAPLGLEWAARARGMAERLERRGPDGRRGVVVPGGRCALGHARLKVIDLETGDQPMADGEGRFFVVFNGEIYNFLDLRRELEARGHRFRTRSDTEVILHGYAEWGEAVVTRLDGMFAFALYDTLEQRLLLARDRAGKKPLYLMRAGDRLLFASQPRAFEALEGVRLAPDPDAFPLYLAYGYVPGPRTAWQGVVTLPPAHAAVFEADGRERRWRYWRAHFRSGPGQEEDEALTLRRRLEAAVEARLIADVPLGAFLSGGVDSSLVVGLMSRLMDEPVRTFSIGFADDPNYDETSFARLAADAFGTDHTEFVVEASAADLL
ncbi:MAG: asparagine synthase (glutamine-hydrolyzing), partial [Gemmatimonadetes bacterium]